MGKILLYYKYTTIEDVTLIEKWQRNLCNRLGLTGRIIIASEGINGTLGGIESATTAYKEAMGNHPLFNDIVFKESAGSSAYFPKLKIMLREEIVRLGISPKILKAEDGGKHLTPQEVHEKISSKNKELIIFDARNNYESAIGAFVNAITPDISTFRELPQYIDNNAEVFKDKEVLMYCTGGVRCERASAYLKSKGLAKNIYQVSGGIHCYLEQYPDGYFRGKNFVFDGRVTLATNEDVLAQCFFCSTPCDTYTHCIYTVCNKLMIACTSCKKSMNNACSTECLTKIACGAPVRTASYKVTIDHES